MTFPEMDDAVLAAIGGSRDDDGDALDANGNWLASYWNPSEDLGQAVKAVELLTEKLGRGHGFILAEEKLGDQNWVAYLGSCTFGRGTATEAVCRAVIALAEHPLAERWKAYDLIRDKTLEEYAAYEREQDRIAMQDPNWRPGYWYKHQMQVLHDAIAKRDEEIARLRTSQGA